MFQERGFVCAFRPIVFYFHLLLNLTTTTSCFKDEDFICEFFPIISLISKISVGRPQF